MTAKLGLARWRGVLLSAVLVLLSGCSKGFGTFMVTGSAMAPGLRPGDKVFVGGLDGTQEKFADGDVVLIKWRDVVVFKRVLAMPGETISGADRKVFRNGKELAEPYLAPPSGDEQNPDLLTFAPRKVGPGEVFVMGDNRDHSFDSRLDTYGVVHFADVIGKYRWTYWHAPAVAKDEK